MIGALISVRGQALILASVVVLIGAILGSTFFRASTTDYSRTPVLFVHGHGLTSADWNPLLHKLKRSGYPSTYLSAIDIRPSRMANVEAAEYFVAPGVEELLSRANATAKLAGLEIVHERVDIVAHSMGAVSSRWYVAKIAPQRVRTWISVAGANHGTNALCEHIDEGAMEMCPAFARSRDDSEIQIDLNGNIAELQDESPYGLGIDPDGAPSISPDPLRHILYLTVRIDPDEWIIPAESAVLAGAGGVLLNLPLKLSIEETSPGNFLLQQHTDHMGMLKDKNFLQLMEFLLLARDSYVSD